MDFFGGGGRLEEGSPWNWGVNYRQKPINLYQGSPSWIGCHLANDEPVKKGSQNWQKLIHDPQAGVENNKDESALLFNVWREGRSAVRARWPPIRYHKGLTRLFGSTDHQVSVMQFLHPPALSNAKWQRSDSVAVHARLDQKWGALGNQWVGSNDSALSDSMEGMFSLAFAMLLNPDTSWTRGIRRTPLKIRSSVVNLANFVVMVSPPLPVRHLHIFS
jgi:hypothetical protein